MYQTGLYHMIHLLTSLPLSLVSVEAAGRVRCGSAGRCRRRPAGSDRDGSGPGPDHRSAAGHTSRGHRYPGTWPAAHAGSAA